MSTFERFEDIESWQKARELTKAIYQATSKGEFAKDFALRDQIRRACISIMSNIAEGYSRGGNKEFINFLAIARGSTGEMKSQLYIALDLGYINQDSFTNLAQMATSIEKLIGGLIRYLQHSEKLGANREISK